MNVVCADPVLTGDESISELGGRDGTSGDQDSRYASLDCVVTLAPDRTGRVRLGQESVVICCGNAYRHNQGAPGRKIVIQQR